MANKSISQLTAGGAVSATDIFPDVQTAGVGPVKVTAAQIFTYVNTPRVVAAADATSITANADTTDIVTQANTQAVGTLTITAPTGTPVDGQRIMYRIQSTNVQTLSFNAVFAASTDISLPASTSGSSKYDYIGFIYNLSALKWQLIATVFGF